MAHLTDSESLKLWGSVTVRTAALFMILSFPGCFVQAVKHDPVRAVLDTNEFLRALYFDENPSRALKLCDEQLRASTVTDDLTKMINQIKGDRGSLRRLAADSYLMVQGPEMELFYVGTYENGVLYHRIVVVGDTSTGYRVSGVWFQKEAYPWNQLRRPFEMEIPVQ